MTDNLYILIHSVNSVNIVTQFTYISLGFNVKNIIISKAEGSAAMSGVPAAQKSVFKEGKNLLYLADITDVKEVIKPDFFYQVVSKKYSSNYFEDLDIIKNLNDGKRVLIAFSGQKSGFTKKEMDLGIPIALKIPTDVGPLGAVAIILNEIIKTQ